MTSMEGCIFCSIAAGKSPAVLEYEDKDCVAFRDADPKYPVHILIVTRKHIASASDALPEDAALLGHLLLTGAKIAKSLNISEKGYRLLTTVGSEAGQTVRHLHVHLLGGRALRAI